MTHFSSYPLNRPEVTFSPLTEACQQNQLCLVRALLDCGEDINEFNGCQYTPLTIACSTRNDEIVKLLIESGADINKPSFSGFKPIHYAAGKNSIECVRLLLDAGAGINDGASYSKYTPLYMAVTAYSEDIVKELLDRGANVNAVDESGYTPFSYAMFRHVTRQGDTDKMERIVHLLENAGGNGEIIYVRKLYYE